MEEARKPWQMLKITEPRADNGDSFFATTDTDDSVFFNSVRPVLLDGLRTGANRAGRHLAYVAQIRGTAD